MKKILNPCKTVDGQVFVKVEYSEDGRLSLVGVIGPKANGNARGGCGQIADTLRTEYPDKVLSEGWAPEMFARLLDTWDRWHLNDMRAGCQHQRAGWDVRKPVVVTDYGWTTKYYKYRMENGTKDPLCARVDALTTAINRPRYETDELRALIAEGWIEAKKTETKDAGWVRLVEHPEGLLGKPCEVCGYKYGSAWLKEEVPTEVIEWLFSLPETTITPAWV